MGTKFNDYIKEARSAASPEDRELAEAFDANYQAVYQEHFALSKQLEAVRKGASFTQDRLAELTGVSQPEISRIESGNANPTQETLAKLGAPFGGVLAFVTPDGRILGGQLEH